jgi:hypothetical protein
MGMNFDWRIASVQGRKAHAHVRDAMCAGYSVMIRTRKGECMSARRPFYVSAVPDAWGSCGSPNAGGAGVGAS